MKTEFQNNTLGLGGKFVEYISIQNGNKLGSGCYVENVMEFKKFVNREFPKATKISDNRYQIDDIRYVVYPEEYGKYIYYSKGTNHNGGDDVAITEAYSLADAMENFKKYYSNVSEGNIQFINCNRDGFTKNMMIVSEY